MTLFRNHEPFHPADACWVRKAYQQGLRCGKRPSTRHETARARWLKRHAGEPIAHRVYDWDDGFWDGKWISSSLDH